MSVYSVIFETIQKSVISRHNKKNVVFVVVIGYERQHLYLSIMSRSEITAITEFTPKQYKID